MKSSPVHPSLDYQLLFNAVPSPCLVISATAEHTIVAVNDAYLRETLTERAALAGRTVSQAFAGPAAQPDTGFGDELMASLEQVVTTRAPDAMTIQKSDISAGGHDDGDDVERYWSRVNYPVLSHDGALVHIVHRMEDITDSVKEVRRANQAALELAHRIQDEARRKDEFLAMLAHELRNPLAGLASASEVLERHTPEGSGDLDTRRLRALSQRQLHNLTRLVDDLLDVSRVSRGVVPMRQETVDLAQVVKDAVALVQAALDERGHVLRSAVTPGSYLTRGDATRLEQVVTNLLTNAVKYTEPGGVIDMRLDRRTENGQATAVLTVRDNGCGIPADRLSTVFDMFVQVDATIDRTRGGLGIGLSLARTLVKLHGGTIRADSAGTGRGSTFTVTLPLKATAQALHHTDAQALPACGMLPLRVLLIEDNDDVREATAALLETLGYEVETAPDGRAGLETIRRCPPDVALVDIGLPEMDGFSVARSVRGLADARHVGLIALSGYSGEDIHRQATAAGFDDQLVKPVDTAQLQQIIDGLVTRMA